MRLLVTRPEPECHLTAERIRSLGHDADEAPLLRVESSAPGRFDLSDVTALAYSSRRAIDALKEHPQQEDLQALPVFTVGDATAAAARKAGYGEVRSAKGNISALGQLILDTAPEHRHGCILYPAAAARAGDLEGQLAAGGVDCRTVVVYRMTSIRAWPPQVLKRLEDAAYGGILIYSKRTAETLLALLQATRLEHISSKVPVYALSAQAGAPLSDVMTVRVAAEPNENALLDLALTQC